VEICWESERLIRIKRCFDSITICELVFEEQRINKHFLMNPKLTGFQVALELYTEKCAIRKNTLSLEHPRKYPKGCPNTT